MNNKRRVISEEQHVISVINTTTEDSVPNIFRHKVVERRIRVLPELVIYDGKVYYDYTDIMRKAFETGQQAYVRKG